MEKALQLLAEHPSIRGNFAEPVMCVDTGEIAFINEWAKVIAKQRDVKPNSVLAYMARKIKEGQGQPVNCWGLRFIYAKDAPLAGRAPRPGRPAKTISAAAVMHSRTK